MDQADLWIIVSMSLGNYCAGLTWELLCQYHLGTVLHHLRAMYQCYLEKIAVVSLGNSLASLKSNVPVLLGKNCTSVTWRQFGQSYFGAFVPVSIKSNCGSLTWKKFHKRCLEIIVLVSLNKIQPVLPGSNCASFIWKQ